LVQSPTLHEFQIYKWVLCTASPNSVQGKVMRGDWTFRVSLKSTPFADVRRQMEIKPVTTIAAATARIMPSVSQRLLRDGM
jgi:hypothetical protein